MADKIEILSIELLNEHRTLVNELKQLAKSLRLEFGWHYLLDLCWIISNLGTFSSQHIMDAGAGTGILQWYLAQRGACVLSVDRESRVYLPLKFRRRFNVQGYQPNSNKDLMSLIQTLIHDLKITPNIFAKAKLLAQELIYYFNTKPVAGQVKIYNQDIQNLEIIPAESFDAVVALSALEHNPPETLPKVLGEIMRVVKPGGLLLATLCAARDRDWFHQPSQGWCYTETSLRRYFNLPNEAPSNYAQFDHLFAELKNCEELRTNLSRFYFQSGNNGMPWGIWNPQYQSVGVIKIKPFSLQDRHR